MLPPNWLRLRVSCVGAKKLRAFRDPFLRNSKTSPWIWFVPDLLTTLTTPPEAPPNSADMFSRCNVNSWTASGFGNGRFMFK